MGLYAVTHYSKPQNCTPIYCSCYMFGVLWKINYETAGLSIASCRFFI